MEWFYVQNGKQVGPVPEAQFDELVRSGRITVETLVWREGLANWRPFGSIGVPASSSPSQASSPPLPSAPPTVLTGAPNTCAECGLALPQTEMIPFAGSWVCARCKPMFFQRVREGAPLAAGGADAWQSGDAVVMLRGGTLPGRCAKCNGAATGEPIEHLIDWHSKWVLSLLLFPVLYFIVYFVLRERIRVSVPVCEKCRRRLRVYIIAGWLLMAIAIVTPMVGMPMNFRALTFISFLGLWFAAMCLSFSKGMLFTVRKVDARYVWLRGFCKEYRASLPEFPEMR